MNTNENVLSYNKRPPKGISWRAVFAGTVTALSAMLILNLIGMAIGLWSIEPTEEINPLSGLGTGAVIWWVLSNLIVLFLGSFVAARVGASFTDFGGMLHGIMTWALYTLVSAWLLTSVVGSIISGIGNVIGGVLSPVGDMIQNQVAPMVSDQFEGLELSLDDARDEFYSLLEDTGKKKLEPDYLESQAERSVSQARQGARDIAQRPRGADADIERVFGESKNRFKQSFEELDEQALVNILVERTDMTEAEAQRTVENTFARFKQARADFEAFMEEAKETANEQAEKIAKAAGDAALYLAIALILGLAAGAVGGFFGVKELREDCEKNNYFVDNTDTGFDRESMM